MYMNIYISHVIYIYVYNICIYVHMYSHSMHMGVCRKRVVAFRAQTTLLHIPCNGHLSHDHMIPVADVRFSNK